MRFTHLAEQIYHRPWFITAGAHASIRMVFERALSSGLFAVGPDLGPRLDTDPLLDLFPKRRSLAIDSDGIASIHIMGPLGKNLSKIEQSCGATSIEQIRHEHATALTNGARGLLLEFDSPGGTITGIPELASIIAAKPIPTVAYTEDVMASAAYYLAAGADAIVASPSAEVGSIGVYIPWMDSSARYSAAGLKPDPIVNQGGDLKAIGFGGSLTEEQRAFLQAEVDQAFTDFKAHVRRYRDVPDDAMRGQCLGGEQARAASLVDHIGMIDDAKAIILGRTPKETITISGSSNRSSAIEKIPSPIMFDPDQPRDQNGEWSSGGGTSSKPKDESFTTAKGHKFEQRGTRLKVTATNGRQFDIELTGYHAPDPSLREIIRKAGLKPDDLVQLNHSANILISKPDVPKIDQLIKNANEHRAYNAKQFDAHVPGYRELSQSHDADRINYEETSAAISRGTPITHGYVSKTNELSSKYPVAASYILAESYRDARNDVKSSIGKKAMERIVAGEDHKKVITDMEEDWKRHARELVDRS